MPIKGKPPRQRRIALILNQRFSAERVRKIVERFYVNSYHLPYNRILYASNKENLYPAVFDRIGGVENQARIFCGRKLELFARKVDNLMTSDVISDDEILVTWAERDPVRKGTA